MKKKPIPGVSDYAGPAGGWPALASVARALRGQMAIADELRALKRVNQPDGFDCPGCAWPDPRHTSSFEFCENGAKAVAWEATGKRATPGFFAAHTLSELWTWSDHRLEDVGRLTHPLRYHSATDRYVAVSWEEAFSRIGEILRDLGDPDAVEFYASGRASNEAAFLYQLFAREYGSNNFPDCSNLCHEASSIGLPGSIGFGKGTVTLDDFAECDAIFCVGHNPGTNHPRMLTTLREAARRGVPIVVLNPMRERGLERFASPQHVGDMLGSQGVPLATTYCQLRVGGDIAALKGIMKALLEADAADLATGSPGLLDRDFIAGHTVGFEALRADLEAQDWTTLTQHSGLDRATLTELAQIYARAERVILCYGMGITQHRHGVDNVQQLANLLLLRGNLGRPGAGICPLRGHSNVQGDRTVGITEAPSEAWCAALEREFGIRVPRRPGHNAVEAIRAIRDGRSRALLCLGGNLAVAMSDPATVFPAMRGLDLSVHVATKLNRSHLLVGGECFLLPCLGRTERDVQASGEQFVTVEDSMSMVHASRGRLQPASDQLRSEPAIVAGIARATLPHSPVDWEGLVADYASIRDRIQAVHPDFADYNARVARPGGFRLDNPASRRVWQTPSGKAQFQVCGTLPGDPDARAQGVLQLATVRSHDQYNTSIYGMDDRYRGVRGRRDVVFVNAADLTALGLAHGDRVDIEAVPEHSACAPRRMPGMTVIACDIAAGSAAAYFPEANVLLDLDAHDARSGTPGYKSIPVRLQPAAA